MFYTQLTNKYNNHFETSCPPIITIQKPLSFQHTPKSWCTLSVVGIWGVTSSQLIFILILRLLYCFWIEVKTKNRKYLLSISTGSITIYSIQYIPFDLYRRDILLTSKHERVHSFVSRQKFTFFDVFSLYSFVFYSCVKYCWFRRVFLLHYYASFQG